MTLQAHAQRPVAQTLMEPFGYSFGCPYSKTRDSKVIFNLDRAMPSIAATFEAQLALWNELCEIEAQNRQNYRRIVDAAGPEVQAARAEVEAAKARVDALVALPRKSRDTNALVEARDKLKAAKLAAKSARAAARLEQKPLLNSLEQERREAVKRAVAESGLWWCQSEVIIERYDVARVRAMKTDSTLRPKSSPFDVGTLHVRWQNGIPLHILLHGGNALASLRFVRSAKRGTLHYDLTICIESDYRDKSHVAVPIVMSREIPIGSIVRSIALFCRRTGDELRWKGTITVMQPERAPAERNSHESLRLTSADTPIDENVEHSLSHVRWLQSVLDRKAKELIERVSDCQVEMLIGNGIGLGGKGIVYGHVKKLAPYSNEARAFLAQTRRMDKERHTLRAKVLRRRNELYRLKARDLCRTYGMIELEKPNLSFASKTVGRGWYLFCKILGYAAKKTGTELVFFAPDVAKPVETQDNAQQPLS